MSKVIIKNVSAAASSMSAGFTPIDPASIDAEIAGYSITPTSFESREYEGSYDAPIFVESYRNPAGINILRYGINIARVLPEPGVWEPSSPVSSFAGPGSSVRSSSTKYSEAEIKSVRHHGVEIAALRMATARLLCSVDKVVICDILERDKAIIKQQLVPHAVLLYKNPVGHDVKHEIVVIDPSNFQYSSHLSSLDIMTSVIHPLLSSIKTFHKTTQIYKPAGSTGFGHDQYRDCIDIAVKLGFGLSQSLPDPSFTTIESVKSNDVVVMVSNMTTVDTYFNDKGHPVRIKQASDTGIVGAFRVIEIQVAEQVKIIQKISSDVQDRISSYDQYIAMSSSVTPALEASVSSIKASKSGVFARLAYIMDAVNALETEYDTLLASGYDLSDFSAYNARLSGEIPTLLDTMDS